MLRFSLQNGGTMRPYDPKPKIQELEKKVADLSGRLRDLEQRVSKLEPKNHSAARQPEQRPVVTRNVQKF